MIQTPREALLTIRQELAPAESENRLVPRIDQGLVPVSLIAELAAQEYRIIRSDRRSLLVLAARCADTPPGRTSPRWRPARPRPWPNCRRSPPPAAWTSPSWPTASRWPAARPTRRSWPGWR